MFSVRRLEVEEVSSGFLPVVPHPWIKKWGAGLPVIGAEGVKDPLLPTTS